MPVEIRRLAPGDEAAVLAAGHLFDGPPRPEATARFLAEPTHHLLVAYEDGEPAGFVTGVETTHPDKGTEMFLYELGVDEPSRRRGTGTALVRALAELARERGCHGMWTGTESANVAARHTYAAAGATGAEEHLFVDWRWAGRS
jgi:ribosomal protein S18 acetylase RimI-like enzyme